MSRGDPLVTQANRGDSERRILDRPDELVIDWRQVDPELIRGDGIPIEELRIYGEKLDELLQRAAGQFVLIVGHEIVSLFPDLDQAARYASDEYPGIKVLIKKIAPFEPVHTLGGATIKSVLVREDTLDR